MEKINIKEIKLVVFDLDNTLWKGLLSEEEPILFDYTKKIFDELLNLGIVISVCSKNNFDDAKKKLNDFGLWDYIVMPSISWENKGPRLISIIKSLGLRDENTLFIDDRIENLKEALYYCQNIKTLHANKESMYGFLNLIAKEEKRDLNHLKLKQYKELELRENNRSNYANDRDFLFDSKIELSIKKFDEKDIDRIYEMIKKTNQLNFTKNRCTLDVLKKDLSESNNWGTVFVKDKYSYYGLVGFYLIKGNRLIHFLFSCRTIGIGVEQYLFEKLGFPELNVHEPVITNLKKEKNLVPWIQERKKIKAPSSNGLKNKKKTNILFKGPCDLSIVTGYINQSSTNIDVEFTFQDEENRSVEHHNSLINIMGSSVLSDDVKETIINKCPFGHKDLYNTKLFNSEYDVIVLSLLTDFTIPTYKMKEKEVFYSCGQFGFPLTVKKFGQMYEDNSIYTGGFKITDEELLYFYENFNYIGLDNDILYKSILYVREHINPNCVLILTAGSEIEYNSEQNQVYKDRHLRHKSFNDLLRSKPIENTYLVDPNYIINKLGQQAFTNNINHYTKQVYLYIAEQINSIIKSKNLNSFKIQKNRIKLFAVLKRKLFERKSKNKFQ